jgi:WD40 repeat protein
VVVEALLAKATLLHGECLEIELLGPRTLVHRVGLGVKWWEYADGGGRRLQGHTEHVMAIAECEGRVCSGSWDGSIRVRSVMGGMAEVPERNLVPVGANDSVRSLSVWQDRLISGHASGKLRAWNAVTGTCEHVLEGHSTAVMALAVCGSRLASGSYDHSIKVWAMRAAGPWTCERTLLGHISWVWSLSGWQGKLLSGSRDKSIRGWDMGTGVNDPGPDFIK